MVPKFGLEKSGLKNPVREDREVIISYLGLFLSIPLRRPERYRFGFSPINCGFNRSG
jgi:hypothetical protein